MTKANIFPISNDTVLQKASVLFQVILCLLYTSDAADERSSVDLGGRRIIKKKTKDNNKKQKKKKKKSKSMWYSAPD